MIGAGNQDVIPARSVATQVARSWTGTGDRGTVPVLAVTAQVLPS